MLLHTTDVVEVDMGLHHAGMALEEVALVLHAVGTDQEAVSAAAHHHLDGMLAAVVDMARKEAWDLDREARLLQAMGEINTTAVHEVRLRWTDSLHPPRCPVPINLSQEDLRLVATLRSDKLLRWTNAPVAHLKFSHLELSHTV